MDKNKQFADLVGIKPLGLSLIPPLEFYEDYADDPRLVLKEMIKRKDWPRVLRDLEKRDIIGLFLDTSGLLRNIAIKWMEENKHD